MISFVKVKVRVKVIIIITLIAMVIGSWASRSQLIVARDRVNMTPWLPSNADSVDESTTSSVVFQRDWSAVNIANEQQDDPATWLVATMLPWSVYAVRLRYGVLY